MYSALLTLIIAFSLAIPAQSFAGWNPLHTEKPEDQSVQNQKVAETIANFKNHDPDLKTFFKKAYGYVVFPTVGKGGMFIGGAYGKGEVFKRGKLIGYSSLSQVTVGLQLGGQAYSEIIFFKDKQALTEFTAGNFEFGAQASAVAIEEGAAANLAYRDGVAVFTMTKAGLMYEAALGGQELKFKPYKSR